MSATDPEYIKLTGTPKINASKSFVKHVQKTPLFAEQIAVKQKTLAAQIA